MTDDEISKRKRSETNPTALGSVAEQSVKDAIHRGRKRRAHRANVSNAPINIRPSQKDPSSLTNNINQIPYHKRRRTSLIPTAEEDSEDSNDEWEEQIEIDPDLAVAREREHKRHLQKQAKKRRKIRHSEQTDRSKQPSSATDNPPSKTLSIDEKTRALLQRRLLARIRKTRLHIHSIHAASLISQLLRHDSIAQSNEDVRALALSIAPVETFNEKIPHRERVSIFALWTRTAFKASVHTVQLNGNISRPLHVRRFSAVERAIRLISVDEGSGNIFDIATVSAAIARACNFRCRIVSALQLTPHQSPKPQSGQKRPTEGEKTSKNEVVQKVLDFSAESIMYCWLEIWFDNKWRAVDVSDGSVCMGEASEVIQRCAERVAEHSASRVRVRKSTSEDEKSRSAKSSTSKSPRHRLRRAGAVEKEKERQVLMPINEITQRRTLPSNFFAHVAAVEDGIVTDVSRRYSKSWSEIEKMRASGKIFAKTIETLGRELRSKDEIESDRLEQQEFDQRATSESVPKTVTAVQKHPRFVLERHIKKYEVIYPKEPIMGYINDEPVYLRSNVHLLHTRDRWIRQMREVLSDAKPLKSVKSKNGTDATVDLYGEWQTKELHIPPVAEDGTVPRGEHGNVDLWTEDHMPAGGVHVNTGYAKMAAKRLGLDFAPAMTGFELRRGRSVPRIEGIVIAKQHEDAVREAALELEAAAFQRQEDKARAEALLNWAKLLRTLKAAETVRRKYGGLVDGRSYETKQKQEGARRAFRERHGLPVDKKDDSKSIKNASHDEINVERVTHEHDYDEEVHIGGIGG